MNGIGVCTRLLPGDPRGPVTLGMTEERQVALKKTDHEKVQRFFNSDFSPEDYIIRGAMVCNSRRDFYYSRFTAGALEEIAEMLPGAPKMAAHDYGSLPLALTYDAKVVKRSDADALRWPESDRLAVESKYIIPNDELGQQVARRIDMGIWREVSLGWKAMGADCSVCGEHIYSCPHVPGDIYRGVGLCEFRFSGVTAALEDSFVWRGGQKGTTTFIPEGADEPIAAVAGAASRLARAYSGDVAWDEIARLKHDSSHDFSTLSTRMRAAVAQFSRAQGYGLMCAEPGERGNTQAIVCARDRFASATEAARFCREHDFRADRRQTTGKAFVFEQFSKDLAEKGKFDEETIDEGVTARICKRIPKEQGAERGARNGADELDEYLEQVAGASQ